MLTDGLLEKIGFTEEQISLYLKFDAEFGSTVEVYSKEAMEDLEKFIPCAEKLREILKGKCHEYTSVLLFLLHCTSFLRENYLSAGYSEELFVDAMKDIRYKLNECQNYKNVFGIFVFNWFKGFFDMTRFALGRLQYDIFDYNDETVNIGDFKIESGDRIVSCHIPSSGRLTRELCYESYKLAYDFFKTRLKNGILVIRCSSWLFYPAYLEVFGENSNTGLFVRDFYLSKILEKEDFNSCWRVFSMDFDGDVSKLPQDTTMQKNFVKYMTKSNKHGGAIGFILFDGKNVLTKR